MSATLAVDTNAVVEWLRSGNTEPRQLREALQIRVLLPVVGELYAGVFASRQRAANLRLLETFLAPNTIIKPDEETARRYGELRARMQLANIRASKMNDLWIAALCLQHSLPLLTNDRGFDSIEDLQTIHW